ncbi:peroxiredoxin [Alkanindiges illinoisensis]|uniref:peroxiredoxin n=1 Tax=Alkanindiges illinoisensis TaxID=197183 RepID=UPI000A0168D8|nr:peroxiredoxin [Alkanindiges illinoisensis]
MSTSIPVSTPDEKNSSEQPSKLPNLMVDSTQGSFNLQTLQGHYTLLYFYPKDLTAGCTTQAQDFRDLLPEFEKLGVKIYGVSRDSLKSHDKFTLKESIPFALISDPDEILCRHFDVIKTKNMYGKQVQGIERSSFLFDQQGQLLQSWRKVKAAGHAALVLNFIQQHI